MDFKNKNEREFSPVYTLSSHSLGITSIASTISINTKLITSSLDRTIKVNKII